MQAVRNLGAAIERFLSEEDGKSGARGIILAAGAGTLLGHYRAWGRGPADGLPEAESEGLPSLLADVLGIFPDAGGGQGGIAFTLMLIGATAFLVGRVARRAGLGARPAAAAAFIFAVFPATGGVLVDPAGPLWLLATLAWLGVLALEPEEVGGARGGLRSAAQVAAAAAALLLSKGAFLVLLPTWPLLAAGRVRRIPPKTRMLFAVGSVLFVVACLLGSHWLSLGFGFAAHEGWAASDPTAPNPAPFFATALLGGLGLGGELPFLTPGRWLPEYARLLGAALMFVLLLVPTPAERVRKLALRVGTLSVVLGAGMAVMIAAPGRASALPAGLLLFSGFGVALSLAALLQAPTRLSTVMGARWRPLYGFVLGLAVMLCFVVQTHRVEGRRGQEWLAAAHDLDPTLPYAALLLSQREQEERGRPHVEPLQRMLLGAWISLLPRDLERRSGLRVARDLEHEQGAGVALRWVDLWLERRQPLRPLPVQVRARRVGLMLMAGRVDEAMAATAEELAAAREPDFAVAASREFLAALSAYHDRPELVDRLLPETERLLEAASEAEGEDAVEVLLRLADLRAGETRYIEADKAAEEAARRAPDDPRPYLAQARILHQLGNRDEALLKMQEATRRDPSHPGVRFMQGRLWAAIPQFAAAGVEQMIAAYLQDPDRAGELSELVAGVCSASELLRSSGRLEQAAKVLDDAVTQLPIRRDLLLERSRVLKAQKRWVDARGPLYELLERDEGNDAACVELAELLRDEGMLLLLKKDRPAAVERFREALALDAPGVSTEAMRAAVESYTAAPSSVSAGDVELARLAFERGIAAYGRGEVEEARKELRDSLRWLPDNPLARLNLGRIELEQGRAEEARPHLQAAIDLGEELRVDVEHAYLLLARALLDHGLPSELDALTRRYRERHPGGSYLEQIEALNGGGG